MVELMKMAGAENPAAGRPTEGKLEGTWHARIAIVTVPRLDPGKVGPRCSAPTSRSTICADAQTAGGLGASIGARLSFD